MLPFMAEKTRARVANGKLVVSCPDSIPPVVRVLDLASMQNGQFQVDSTAANGQQGWTLVQQTPEASQPIATYDSAEKATSALKRVAGTLRGQEDHNLPFLSWKKLGVSFVYGFGGLIFLSLLLATLGTGLSVLSGGGTAVAPVAQAIPQQPASLGEWTPEALAEAEQALQDAQTFNNALQALRDGAAAPVPSTRRSPPGPVGTDQMPGGVAVSADQILRPPVEIPRN